jgi:6-pyruvoyltetrahydropterin/6-carboxytetrahydropterin synthase
MTFQISTTHDFSAAHQLRMYDGSLEPVHGHNWRVRVTVGSEKLDQIGVVMDFHELERLVDEIIRPMHNGHLNQAAMFTEVNPSAENVAVYVGKLLAPKLPNSVRLLRIEVWETESCRAVYQPRAS